MIYESYATLSYWIQNLLVIGYNFKAVSITIHFSFFFLFLKTALREQVTPILQMNLPPAGVVQGYRPQVDWGGESGSATIVLGQHNVKLATSGWRRRCLFTLLVALLVISVTNFVLTLWIIKCIKFNTVSHALA